MWSKLGVVNPSLEVCAQFTIGLALSFSKRNAIFTKEDTEYVEVIIGGTQSPQGLTLASDATGKLNVFGHDGDSLGVHGTQVSAK